MVSVTQRIKQIKQPRGGYLPVKTFTVTTLDDGQGLNPEESIAASLVGTAVDYLSRFMDGTAVEKAFEISLLGARAMRMEAKAFGLLDDIKGLDDLSIIKACQLAGFDSAFRAGPLSYRPVESIVPDQATITNIRIMVERSLSFFKAFSPVTADGFTMEGAYTATITTGDGDFLTKDTLWDFKVTTSKPNKDHTLQLLSYYLMGMVFYKYLSDKMLFFVAETMEEETESLEEALAVYRKYYEDEETHEDLLAVITDEMSYAIHPDLTFTALVERVNDGSFQLEDLAQGFRDIEQSDELYENLFEDIDLYSKKLGATPQKQNQTVAAVMKELAVLDVAGHAGDMLGDAYEYLIGQFATDSGKKAGEFYTPQPVAKLMTQIAFLGREDKQGFTLYDATMGSGSLLLNAKRYSRQPQTVVYFGQELNTSTYNLARMNMILHGVPIENQFLHNADTLDEDWPTQEPTNFDGVLMNPPYSAKWSASSGFMDDPRFSPFGKLAPKSKADFAFLLHGYYHLKQDNGVMAIVLPHGVLFRGNAEGTIRKALLEEGAIDTVIGLPANIFFNTSIPTTVIILKKNRTNRDVYFIDASKEFDKGKNQNIMTDAHIEKILNAYRSREDMDKFAHLASFEEIVENDYNLNIPRYVDIFEEEEVEPLTEIVAKINQTNATIESQTASLLDMLGQLHGTTPEADEELKAFVKAFKG